MNGNETSGGPVEGWPEDTPREGGADSRLNFAALMRACVSFGPKEDAAYEAAFDAALAGLYPEGVSRQQAMNLVLSGLEVASALLLALAGATEREPLGTPGFAAALLDRIVRQIVGADS